MPTLALFLLAILDWFAEATQLTYEVGALTRKYAVPAAVALYVLTEMAWDRITSMEYTMKVYNTPLTTGFA